MMLGPTPNDSFMWYTMYGTSLGGISSCMLLRWKMRPWTKVSSSGSSLSALKTTFRRSNISNQPRRCVGDQGDLESVHELMSHVLDRRQDDGVLAVPADLQPDAVIDRVEESDGVADQPLLRRGSQPIPGIAGAVLPRRVFLGILFDVVGEALGDCGEPGLHLQHQDRRPVGAEERVTDPV